MYLARDYNHKYLVSSSTILGWAMYVMKIGIVLKSKQQSLKINFEIKFKGNSEKGIQRPF